MTVTAEKRVAQFVALRDKIKQIKEKHAEELKPYNDALEALGNVLLHELNTAGAESIRTTCGTFYRTKKVSASIADAEAFWQYVVSNQDWDMLDRRANKTAVAAYIEAHKTPPPGINWSTYDDVNVRRS